jgi:hypothetical protein
MTLNCYKNLQCFLYISKLVLEPTIENQPPPPIFEPRIEALLPHECLEDSLEEEEPIEDRNVWW